MRVLADPTDCAASKVISRATVLGQPGLSDLVSQRAIPVSSMVEIREIDSILAMDSLGRWSKWVPSRHNL